MFDIEIPASVSGDSGREELFSESRTRTTLLPSCEPQSITQSLPVCRENRQFTVNVKTSECEMPAFVSVTMGLVVPSGDAQPVIDAALPAGSAANKYPKL